MKINLENLEKFLLEEYKKNDIKILIVDREKFYVLPKVFSPIIFKETLWFAQKISSIVKKKSLLEIGVGSGLISFICAKKGATVYGTDINPHAIKNTKLNFDNAGLKIELFKSDVYEKIPKRLKFDFIFWNHPFHKLTEEKKNILLKSVFDFKYISLKKYLTGAKKHLTENGRLLLGTGDVNNFDEIERLSQRTGYNIKIINKSKPMRDIARITNYIIEFKKKNRK